MLQFSLINRAKYSVESTHYSIHLVVDDAELSVVRVDVGENVRA